MIAGAQLRRARPGPAAQLTGGGALGYSLLELMFVVSIGVTATAAAVPQYLAGLDDFRTSGAARYLSARLFRARSEAVMRSRSVAIQFVQTATGYEYGVYMDGNDNAFCRDTLGMRFLLPWSHRNLRRPCRRTS